MSCNKQIFACPARWPTGQSGFCVSPADNLQRESVSVQWSQGPKGQEVFPALACCVKVEVSDWICVRRGFLSIDLLDKNSAECQGEVTKAPRRGSRAQCETSGSTAEDDLKALKGQPRRSGTRTTCVSALGGRAPYAPLGVELRRRVRLCGHSPCVL